MRTEHDPLRQVVLHDRADAAGVDNDADAVGERREHRGDDRSEVAARETRHRGARILVHRMMRPLGDRPHGVGAKRIGPNEILDAHRLHVGRRLQQ